jgi:hypothetical protein
MRFFVTLLLALTLTLAWQGAAFADSHAKPEDQATEAGADQTKDSDAGKKKGNKKDDEECE